jgi:general secretion pathway protein K
MSKQSGLALVMVLWILSLLTIMAGSFALNMRREASITMDTKNNAQALAVAESGIAMAEMMLLNPDQNKRWRSDGSIYEIITNDAKVRVRLLSETGKIDINKADQVLLEALMTYVPGNTEQKAKLVAAIIDWRDADDLVHNNGAEKKEYKEAGLSYEPRNKPFQTLEELQLVLGINEAVFFQIEPLITVYSGQPKVSVQQATKEVLQIIPDLDTSLIDSYMTARLDSAINNLPAPTFPSSVELTSTNTLPTIVGQPPSTEQTNTLTLVSEAVLKDESSAIISMIIKPLGSLGAQNTTSLQNPFQILKWQQVMTNNRSLFVDAMSELLVKQYAEPEFNN